MRFIPKYVVQPFTLFLLASYCTSLFCIAQTPGQMTIALLNGSWFNGKKCEAKTLYSVDGFFTAKKPQRIDTTINLQGLYIVPPFAEAHNHNIGTGVEEWDKKAINAYLQAGVFYVKIQSNLPVHDSTKAKFGLNRFDGLDVSFAQANITATNGHPIQLINETLLPRGYFPGHTKETLKDYRYFVMDSEEDIKSKWPAFLHLKPDFIKVVLSYSDEHEKRKADTTPGYSKGLNPALLPQLVNEAHAAGLRLSVHVSNVADFSNAVASRVDEIVHLPIDTIPVSVDDAKLAAKKNIVVITTCSLAPRMSASVLPKAKLPQAMAMHKESVKRLREAGVKIAVGSDDVRGTLVEEALFLQSMDVFDNATLLRMWTEITPQTIFPKRKIGLLKHNYEASFLALEGNPLEDFGNVKKIRLQFKQGHELVIDGH